MNVDLADFSSVSGWSACALLVGLNVWGFFRDWVVTRGSYNAMKDILEGQRQIAEASAAKWELVATEALSQNSKLIALGIGTVGTPRTGAKLGAEGK